MSHWVTVFKKKTCQKRSKSSQKLSKTVKTDRFWTCLTVFDRFWPFFLKHSDTVTQYDTHFFVKHSDSMWQTFFFLNTVTKCDKFFFKHSDLFFSGKFIFRKKLKIWWPFKNKFQDRRKISLEYLTSKKKLEIGGIFDFFM